MKNVRNVIGDLPVDIPIAWLFSPVKEELLGRTEGSTTVDQTPGPLGENGILWFSTITSDLRCSGSQSPDSPCTHK